MAMFEISPVYLVSEEGALPDEPLYLAIALSGPRQPDAWQGSDRSPVDFYDLKGILTGLIEGLHVEAAFGPVRWEPFEHPSFHPGRSARMLLGDQQIGVMGELHPLVARHYSLPQTPVLAAEVNVQALLEAMPERFAVEPVSAYPPVLEDIAVIVDEEVPAARVEGVIRQAGGQLLRDVRLFDIYRGAQIGTGKKSLAYSLTYQAQDRTLTDAEAAQVRNRVVRRLEQELGAKLRS
jgi:phenylalanyl-tRNA synthetase beta chain